MHSSDPAPGPQVCCHRHPLCACVPRPQHVSSGTHAMPWMHMPCITMPCTPCHAETMLCGCNAMYTCRTPNPHVCRSHVRMHAGAKPCAVTWNAHAHVFHTMHMVYVCNNDSDQAAQVAGGSHDMLSYSGASLWPVMPASPHRSPAGRTSVSRNNCWQHVPPAASGSVPCCRQVLWGFRPPASCAQSPVLGEPIEGT